MANLVTSTTACAWRHQVRSIAGEIQVGHLTRTYRLYVPSNLRPEHPAPLVLAFHGGGSDGIGTERLTGFSELADRTGFIVVYPDGIGENWNDGRDASVSKAHRENVDDIAFIAALIDKIAAHHRIDPKRIYATGISNGAIFSHYLAANLSDRIAAIAPVVGGIADPFDQRFNPDHPVAVFIIQGTDDPLVPYEGGGIAKGRRGKIIATDDAVMKWVNHDGASKTAKTGTLPDIDPTDGCQVTWSTWSNGRAGTEVTLYTLKGAGHTWPGGTQYLPKFIVGGVCRDFDATEAIWDFFNQHPKQ